MSKKILNHPDKEDIIKKLLEGDSVKSVEAWLKKKYPRTKRLHVSYMTLQKFRGENLNLKGDVLDDIKNKRTEVDKKALEAETKLVISSSSAYQKKIDEIASSELDVARRLLEMDKVIGSRIEHYYNLLENGGTTVRDDKVFIVEREEIRDLGNFFSFFCTSKQGLYRPLRTTLYALTYFMWGTNPVGYHIVGVLLHLMTTYLIFLIGWSLTGKSLASMLTALFFAVHPIHTERITFITASYDVLGDLFSS